MNLRGKGFFIWKIQDCEKGNPQAIASAAQAAGLSHILIKIADGNYPYNLDSKTRVDLVPPVVSALRSRGIAVWGWHYVYGYDPLGEARIAIQRLKELGLDGYVIDAETEYKEPGRENNARRFMNEYRKAFPNLPTALSSYRFPTYHRQLPWREFLEACDYSMPQVYWEKSHNAAANIKRCLKEYQQLVPYRPVILTGPGYKWDGWRPTEDDLREFFQTAEEARIPAVNFFSWDECRRDLPNLWNLIAKYNYGSQQSEEKPKALPEQLIQALNSRQTEQIINLYRPDAVHINAKRTIQGHAAIRSWYEALLHDRLPETKFQLTGSAGQGASWRFSWRVSPQVDGFSFGKDTLGVIDGKIVYHYTTFS